MSIGNAARIAEALRFNGTNFIIFFNWRLDKIGHFGKDSELKGRMGVSLAMLVEIIRPYFSAGTNLDMLRELLSSCVPQEDSGDCCVDAINDPTLSKIVSGERDLPRRHAAEILREFDQNALELFIKENLKFTSDHTMPSLCKALAPYSAEPVTEDNMPQVIADMVRSLVEEAATARRRNSREQPFFSDETGDWDFEERRRGTTINGHILEQREIFGRDGKTSRTVLIDGKKVQEVGSGEDIMFGRIADDGTVMHYEPGTLESTGLPMLITIPLQKFSPDDPKLKNYLEKQERQKKRLGIIITGEADTRTTDE